MRDTYFEKEVQTTFYRYILYPTFALLGLEVSD